MNTNEKINKDINIIETMITFMQIYKNTAQ